MADDILNTVTNMVDVKGLFGGFTDLVMWVVILAGIGAIVLFGWLLSQYKHKFRLKTVINNRKIITDHKARTFKDKDGIEYWQLMIGKRIVPLPPPQAIEIDAKGKKCVEAYETEYGEIIYAKDTARIKDLPKDIDSIEDKQEREQEIKQWIKENNIIASYKPLTTNHKNIMQNQYRKALERKKKSWQEYIMPIVGMAALVILVVALMIFYEDMGKPLLSMADKQNSYATIQKEQLQIIKEIKNDIQVLKGEDGSTKPPPN